MPAGAREKKDLAAINNARNLENVPWCEDYEKMISGMLYSCLAPELEAGRIRARKLTTKFNTHLPDDATMASLSEDRMQLLQQLFGHIGEDSYMEPSIQVDYGCNISVGERFYANFKVLFGTGVSLITATHETSLQSRRDNVEYAEPITIGDDCWFGANVTVLPGVTIGRGCTIGAGSVVTKDVPEYSVAMGVPARVVRKVESLE